MIELKWEVNKIVAVLMLLNMTREKKIHLELIYCKPNFCNENPNVLSEFESFKCAISGLMIL